jgi:hypothetical protein
MMAEYEKLPEWIRWVLLLPIVIIGALLIVSLLALIREDFFLINALASILTSMFLMHSLAPRFKTQLAGAVIVSRILLVGTLYALIFISGEEFTRQSWLELIREVVSWVIAIIIYFKVFLNE